MRVVGGFALLFALGVSLPEAAALPLYALGSAHTCGNCHTSPTYQDPKGWTDPELGARKCNLSCTACHVNPAGGGLRNTSGRYFGRSSLALVPYEERSYSDVPRELLSPETIAAWGMAPGRGVRSRPSAAHTSSVAATLRTIPSSWADVEVGIGSDAPGSWLGFGRPLLGPSEYAFWDGRYGDLLADPLVAFGLDVRLAAYTGASSPFFPMQLDLDAAVHPVEHVTAMATLAGRGRAAGFGAVGAGDQLPVFLRSAFVMVHELPYMTYAKAGIFMPPFGTYTDDHTSFIRKDFELSLSTSESTVIGGELGFAANYPYANVAVFKNSAQSTAPDPSVDPGWGAAGSLGWRALGWNLGAHAMVKRRALEAGGELEAAGLTWGLGWPLDLPLSYMGELSLGRRPATLGGGTITNLALYQELVWSLYNGLSLHGKYDLADRELGVAGQVQQRLAVGLEAALIPGLTFFAQVRAILPGSGESPGADLFVQTHVWF